MDNISDILLDWYARHGRDLPWRRTRDPYRIWLSEVILQQTRVAQGMDYYLRFTERFPDVGSLAAAPEDEVLKLWQGLGYYSRACNLHAAARQVAERFGGVFPRSYDEVRSLRGVGDYTAAAVCSAAYDAPCAVLDGNVFRVLARLFDIDLPIDSTAGKRTFAELAQTQLDMRCPGRYNQAVMDFGALHSGAARMRRLSACGALSGSGRRNGCGASRQAGENQGARPLVQLPARHMRRPDLVAAARGRRHLAGIVRVSDDRDGPCGGFLGTNRFGRVPNRVGWRRMASAAERCNAETPALAPDAACRVPPLRDLFPCGFPLRADRHAGRLCRAAADRPLSGPAAVKNPCRGRDSSCVQTPPGDGTFCPCICPSAYQIPDIGDVYHQEDRALPAVDLLPAEGERRQQQQQGA